MLRVVRARGFKWCDYSQLVIVSPKFRLERKRSDRKARRRYKARDWDVTQWLAPFAESKGRLFEIWCKNVLILAGFTVWVVELYFTFWSPKILRTTTDVFSTCYTPVTFWSPKILRTTADVFSTCYTSVTFWSPKILKTTADVFSTCYKPVTFWSPKILRPTADVFSTCYTPVTFWSPKILRTTADVFSTCYTPVTFWSPKILRPTADVFSTCYTPVLTISIIESTAVESRLFDQA